MQKLFNLSNAFASYARLKKKCPLVATMLRARQNMSVHKKSFSSSSSSSRQRKTMNDRASRRTPPRHGYARIVHHHRDADIEYWEQHSVEFRRRDRGLVEDNPCYNQPRRQPPVNPDYNSAGTAAAAAGRGASEKTCEEEAKLLSSSQKQKQTVGASARQQGVDQESGSGSKRTNKPGSAFRVYEHTHHNHDNHNNSDNTRLHREPSPPAVVWTFRRPGTGGNDDSG
jgi:hypothetical protein